MGGTEFTSSRSIGLQVHFRVFLVVTRILDG